MGSHIINGPSMFHCIFVSRAPSAVAYVWSLLSLLSCWPSDYNDENNKNNNTYSKIDDSSKIHR